MFVFCSVNKSCTQSTIDTQSQVNSTRIMVNFTEIITRYVVKLLSFLKNLTVSGSNIFKFISNREQIFRMMAQALMTWKTLTNKLKQFLSNQLRKDFVKISRHILFKNSLLPTS